MTNGINGLCIITTLHLQSCPACVLRASLCRIKSFRSRKSGFRGCLLIRCGLIRCLGLDWRLSRCPSQSIGMLCIGLRISGVTMVRGRRGGIGRMMWDGLGQLRPGCERSRVYGGRVCLLWLLCCTVSNCTMPMNLAISCSCSLFFPAVLSCCSFLLFSVLILWP